MDAGEVDILLTGEKNNKNRLLRFFFDNIFVWNLSCPDNYAKILNTQKIVSIFLTIIN